MTIGKLNALLENEEVFLEALLDAYNAGKLEYLQFSPAYDYTMCVIVALKAKIAALTEQPQ